MKNFSINSFKIDAVLKYEHISIHSMLLKTKIDQQLTFMDRFHFVNNIFDITYLKRHFTYYLFMLIFTFLPR